MRRPNTNALTTHLLAILFLGLASGCGEDKPATPTGTGTPATPPTNPTGEAPSVDLVGNADLVRERVAAHVSRDERSRAREVLRPLVERADAAFEDLLSGAAIELADNHPDAAQKFLDRAVALQPKSPAVAYLRGQMARDAGESKQAREFFRTALAAAPNDLPTKLGLAEAEDELDDPTTAERLYKEIIAVGPGNGAQWYVAAVYRLSNLLTRAGPDREEEARKLDPIVRSFEARGIQAPNTIAVLLGELGRVRPPTPSGSRAEPLARSMSFRAGTEIAIPSGATAILTRDVDGDLDPDLVVRGSDATVLLPNDAHTLGGSQPVVVGKSTTPLFFDVDNDGDLDMFAVTPQGPVLRVREGAEYVNVDPEWPALPAGVESVIACDYDHEGDLDLVFCGAFGVRVWRNDSALDRSKDGVVKLVKARFADASDGSGLPANGLFEWITAEDFDGDNDVDLLVHGPQGIVVYDSLRDGKFALKRGVFDLPMGLASEPIVADFDGDARPDLFFAGAPSVLSIQGAKAAQRAEVRARTGSIAAADVDLDGSLDVLWLDEASGELKGILALGLANERMLAVAAPVPTGDRLAIADFDGDCKPDLAVESAGKLHIHLNTSDIGNGARFAWKGLRDNRRAVGAVVEYRVGPVYRRIYWRGEPEVLGLGRAKSIDVLRVTWPNGVQTTRLDTSVENCGAAMDPAEALGVLTQADGQVGSCPFLYTWNGKEFEFITDVLGITPLGLRMAPGMFVPPDHDEYVLVMGEQLAPKDGEYVMQFTEELREVTYLDHAKMLVVDSPIGTEIYPNERFQFPPFPEPHVHTVRAPLAPTKATGSDGRDWTDALRKVDDVFPQPMELHPAQFAGLAKPWFLELEFDPAAVRDASALRLVMTGWFYWSDASANMAAARAEGVDFVPPMFQVPDGQGGWRETGPPVGFPAGKTKTMIVDVAPFLDRADPRVRVSTTLRLYWDRIVLATDGDDAPLRVQEVACTSAESWRRGFSAPLDSVPPGEAHPANKPERFDWNVLANQPRWNQHPGLYTRYGACTELLKSVDDRFLILGAGDAATLRFSAEGVEAPAPGMRRDYLLYLDGWAKDRDPNTIEALNVEPLPFHAMSGYPYRADEHFPDGAVHKKWRAQWLTRPAADWIAPVSPRREVEAILGRP